MSNEPANSPEPDFLSEDEAHRVLARAVELDARAMSDVPIAQLRTVAAEAGITSAALDRALSELRAGHLPGGDRAGAQERTLSEQLRRFRGHVALVIVVGVAAVTPGDHVSSLAVYTLPIYGLYELCIRLLRARERGGPSAPATGTLDTSAGKTHSRAPADKSSTPNVSLRPSTFAPAT